MNIAFIGLGEAATALISGWGPTMAAQITGYDIKSDDPATATEIESRSADLGIRACRNLADAVQTADIVFCTVTADQAVAVAQAASEALRDGTLWLDLNSCAPSSKAEAADIINAAGGRYVDVAVMSPVYPKQNMVPLLLSGPVAQEAAQSLSQLPMAPRIVNGPVGAASSIKMIRSIMVKGLEALTAECTLAAVAAGVEDEVFASLNKSHPGREWEAQAAYNFERAIVHGERRAAEMEEVCKTLADLGLPADMAASTVKWQRSIAQAGALAPMPLADLEAKPIATALLQKLRH